MGVNAYAELFVGIEITKEQYVKGFENWLKTLSPKTVEKYTQDAKDNDEDAYNYMITELSFECETFDGCSYKFFSNDYEFAHYDTEGNRYLFVWYSENCDHPENNFKFLTKPKLKEKHFKFFASQNNIKGPIVKVLTSKFL